VKCTDITPISAGTTCWRIRIRRSFPAEVAENANKS
jgi:hypothetical protein